MIILFYILGCILGLKVKLGNKIKNNDCYGWPAGIMFK